MICKISDVINKEIKGIWGDEPKTDDEVTPVIKTNNMTYEGNINYDSLTLRYIPKEKLLDSYLSTGDLLIEKSGGTKYHSVGYINFFDGENNKYVCNNFVLVLRPNKALVKPKFLFYQIKYKYESNQFSDCYNKTTGIQNLQIKSYISKIIKCPDISTQSNQTHSLDKICSCIHKKKKQIDFLDSLVKSRFNEMFGDPNLNKCLFKKERIDHFVTCVAGATPSTSVEQYWNNGTISWLSSGEVNKGRIFFTDKKITNLGYKKTSTKMIPCHTVVMAMAGQGNTRGTVGVAEIPLCTNQSICSLVGNKELIDTDYLYVCLNLMYELIRSMSNGAEGRGGLNLKIIGGIEIPLPPLTLQNRFAAFVKQIDKSKFFVQKQIKDLQELLDSKMDEYFGGAEE